MQPETGAVNDANRYRAYLTGRRLYATNVLGVCLIFTLTRSPWLLTIAVATAITGGLAFLSQARWWRSVPLERRAELRHERDHRRLRRHQERVTRDAVPHPSADLSHKSEN